MHDGLRRCTVDGKPKYFHRWMEKAWIVAPSPLVGGHEGGVVKGVFAIVEDVETRTIEQVPPDAIKFENTEIRENVYSKWVHEGKPIHCKVCGFEPTYSLNADNSIFCPHCGANMRKREENG